MTATFADTSFYVAIVSPHDAWHQAAISASRQVSGRTITTEFVLIEVANFLTDPANRQLFTDLLALLRSSRDVEIIPASTELFAAGLDLFQKRPDKQWSLTDCTSFVIMQRAGISDALTTDSHFEQAGFTRLIRGES